MNRAEIQGRVDRLFERIEHLSDSELVMLRTIWDVQDRDQREEAWQAVKAIVRAHKRTDMLDDARSRLSAWVNNYITAPVVVFTAGWQSGMDAAGVRKAALPPLLDAVAATIAADRLDASEQALLLEPMTQVAPQRKSR